MHVPHEMLEGPVCPVTVGITAAGIAGAALVVSARKEQSTLVRLVAISTLVFAACTLTLLVHEGILTTTAGVVGGLVAFVTGTAVGWSLKLLSPKATTSTVS